MLGEGEYYYLFWFFDGLGNEEIVVIVEVVDVIVWIGGMLYMFLDVVY